MLKDQRDLLSEFNARNVRFLIVGGYAYSHYTEPRATKDLDLFIDTSSDNTAKVFAALVQFGAPLKGLTAADFQDSESFYQIGVAPNRIDILKHIDGVAFETAWKASEAGTIDNDIPVHFISLDDLILNKKTVGRLRDLADVEDLQNAEKAALSQTKLILPTLKR